MNIASHPRLLALLSAAHALGTLRAGARRRFETLAREQAVVRASALLWQERLTAFVELAPAVEPAPAVWTRIRNLVDAEQASERAAAAAARRPPPARASWWSSLVLWRGAAAFGLCASVVLGIVSQQGGGLGRGAAPMQYVAVLADERASASMLVTVDARSGQLTMQRVGDYREAADRSLQLWALPPGQAPQSLGVLQSQGAGMTLAVDAATLRRSPALAISLEPKGGVPGAGGPTGPVLFKGALIQRSL
ncbi:MAG: RNA polymerase subunit sigma-70 [Comamonadaceae bacterium]|nr:MAG: RNA polymerase subunit sigma-70 [Comamonadaceae bacterium]